MTTLAPRSAGRRLESHDLLDLRDWIVTERPRGERLIESRFEPRGPVALRCVADRMGERAAQRIEAAMRRGLREHRSIARENRAAIRCEQGEPWIVRIFGEMRSGDDLHIELAREQNEIRDHEEPYEPADRAIDIHAARTPGAVSSLRPGAPAAA